MRLIGRLGAVVVLASTLVSAQEATVAGWVPALELRVVSSYPDGARPGSFGQWKLAKDGPPIAATVWSGPTLCSIGISGAGTVQVTSGGGPEIASRTAASANVWTIGGEYLGEKDRRQNVRVTTRFERLGGRDSSESSTVQTLSLREGDAVTLDAMRGGVDSSCQVRTVTLEARLAMQATSPELTRAQYEADLWLVRTNPAGEERRDHVVTSLDGSGAVPFKFNRLAFTVSTTDPRLARFEAFIQLGGSLRARPRADGQIEVDLDTDPTALGVENLDRPAPRPPGVTRRKTLTLKADETTAIDFPLAAGVTGFATASDSNGHVVRVFYEKVFAGHKMQLLIRLHRIR